MNTPDRRQSTDRVDPAQPGLYRITREVRVDDGWRHNEIICRNPAYGYRELDRWEDGLRVLSSAAPEVRRILRHATRRSA